jgi:hypothetical protein
VKLLLLLLLLKYNLRHGNDQFPQPHEAVYNIIVVCISFFISLEMKDRKYSESPLISEYSEWEIFSQRLQGWTLLLFSCNYILIKPVTFMVVEQWMKILQKTSLLTK